MSWSKEKQRAYSVAYHAANRGKLNARTVVANGESRVVRRAYIRALKLESGCVMCGYSRCASALDFHHRIEDKKNRNIANLVNRQPSWARLNREIAKCVILCRNCHNELHAGLDN